MSLFVCEGAKDGWWLWQALQGSLLLKCLCIIFSTHGSGIPDAWRSPPFWQGWRKVYLAQDTDAAGEALAHRVREVAGRDVLRVRVPEDYGEDWTDFFRSGQTADDLTTLLEAAKIFGVMVRTPPSPTSPRPGSTHAVAAVDVSRAYVDGYLYVPFRVLERQTGPVKGRDGLVGEQGLQHYRTLVVRSDGVVCTFSTLPAPRGTPRGDRVLALSDGTLISRAPVSDTTSTFSPPAITRFIEAKATGRSAMTLTTARLLEGVHEHLKVAASLAYDEDYALLTFAVVASYAQAIFDAVPLVQIVGPGGPELGRALAQIGSNASLITSRTSATQAARMLDRSAGLTVIDDLAEIRRHRDEGELGAFIGLLGSSTRKDTARMRWIDPRNRRIERLDVYGVKVVVDPLGTTDLRSTPGLKVYTRPARGEAVGPPMFLLDSKSCTTTSTSG